MAWNRDDLTAGLVFLGTGLFFAANTLIDLDIGSAASMGPGFFPLALCIVLTLLGAAILLNARGRQPDVERQPLNWRPLVFVILAPIAFGLTLRSLGLVPALAITIALAVTASRVIGLVRGTAIVVGMTAFCVAVFYYGLQLPIDLFNSSFIY